MNDEYLPGNVNSLVGRGDVYDKEIGFYYMSGLYYSPLVQKFLSKNLEIEFVEYDLAPAVMVEDEIVNMYSTLRATSGYGADIPYYVTGPGWTLSVSDGELLARLIYGECTYSSTGYYDQRAAIAWVINNRVNYTGTRFPHSLRGVALQGSGDTSEFRVISGLADETANARINIQRNEAAWSEATLFACTLICSNDYRVSMELYLPKPNGISNQMFFSSKVSWNSSYNASNQTVNGNAVTNIALNVGNIPECSGRNIFFNYVSP